MTYSDLTLGGSTSAGRLSCAVFASVPSCVEHLTIRAEDLETRAILSRFVNLKGLDIFEVFPNEFDSFDLFKELFYLQISDTSLTDPPDLSNNTKLERLILSRNSLRSPPNLSANNQLKYLNLSHNRLTVSPNLYSTPLLYQLDLSHNQLTAPPSLEATQILYDLNLSDNQLTQAPNLSCKFSLSRVVLSNNRLTELNDSFLRLPRSCQVYLEGNAFSDEYIERFTESLYSHRSLNPSEGPDIFFSVHNARYIQEIYSDPLKTLLLFWIAQCKNAPHALADRFISLLNEPQQLFFAQFLTKLKDAYQKNRDADFSDCIARMLELACQNEPFRKELLKKADDGSTRCSDRALVFLNEIEILWHFHHKNLSLSEYRNLCIRESLYQKLLTTAYHLCLKNGLGDQIETALRLAIDLKEKFQLPISSTFMLHGEASGVTEEIQRDAELALLSISEKELLKSSSYWMDYIEKTRPSEVQEINEKYNDLIENLRSVCSGNPLNHPELEVHFQHSAFPKEYIQGVDILLDQRSEELFLLGEKISSFAT